MKGVGLGDSVRKLVGLPTREDIDTLRRRGKRSETRGLAGRDHSRLHLEAGLGKHGRYATKTNPLARKQYRRARNKTARASRKINR